MAKFTIALCFMALVTSCVSQGSIFSALTNQVTGTLTSLVGDATKHQSTIVDGISNATNAFATLQKQVTDVAQDVITKNTGVVGGLISSATGDAGSCIAQNIDLKEIVLEYASNAIKCGKNALDTLLNKCSVILDEFKNYMKIFGDWTTKTILCASDMKTFESCITLVWTSVQNEIPNIWTRILSQVTVLNDEFTEFRVSLESCGSSAAVTTIMTEVQKSQGAVAKCILALG